MNAPIWMRRRQWAAHAFVDGHPICSNVRPGEPPLEVVDELAPGGVPYGRVCQHCLTRLRRGLGPTGKERTTTQLWFPTDR
jgi:hypothetical protein